LPQLRQGDEVPAQTVILEVEGDGCAILTAERTVLNLVMRMSGIAIATRNLVKKVREAGSNVKIAATRKIGLMVNKLLNPVRRVYAITTIIEVTLNIRETINHCFKFATRHTLYV
jgi:hypothetical protein